LTVPGGRPRKEIDFEIVRKLAAIGCTNAEIGAWFNCDESTIRGRCSEEVRLGKEDGKTSLRRMQWKRARAGSDTMLIHLGKHMLGQTDKVQVTGPDDIIDEIRRETGQQGMAEESPESDAQ
jgi:hypothetical protein